ncbi:MAG: HrpE/YscL family type III secretion apparatus protein [Deltaproteobacteria bacterium]|jgi:type III secretion protein L|nr:HrpE/YscL family type III secretion apparatus protein [Deltaproteobacteria bacterium]
MASLFRISAGGIAASPDSRLIRAGEWANYCAARDIAAAAQQYAANLRREAEEAFAAEKQRGYEEGLRESRQEHAENMMETVLKSIDYIEGLEKGIAGLVGDALRRILGEIPPEDRIAGVVRQSLNLVRGQKRVTLVVAPEDEPLIRAKIDELLREYASIAFIDVAADGRLARGACLLQSDMGVIDAGIETQIRAIINTLEKRRKG